MRMMIPAAESADRNAAAGDNSRFLDELIIGVARCTGRVYGQSTYERLLDAFQIRRRPSAQTWSKAIQRVNASGLAVIASTQELTPALMRPTDKQASVPPAATSAAPLPMGQQIPDDELIELKTRAQVAESALRDAYTRISGLEAQRASLLDRATVAEAAAKVSREQIENERAEHAAQVKALTDRLGELSQTVTRLSGLERHLHVQTDALRQELGQQRDLYKGRAEAAEKALAAERTQTDALRRILGNRAHSEQK
jgi:regulator of replication initiation timing